MYRTYFTDYPLTVIFTLLQIIRLGHPARVYPHLQRFSLDAVLMRSDSAEIIQNVRNDIQKAQVYGIIFHYLFQFSLFHYMSLLLRVIFLSDLMCSEQGASER